MDSSANGECRAHVLPSHPPADMLDLFMTRYDYDYNRDPAAPASGGSGDDGISGDVRNRPIFGDGGAWDGNTTYTVDYCPRTGGVAMPHLVAASRAAMGNPESAASAYVKDWYRPDLTRNATDDGHHPDTVYKADYTFKPFAPQGRGAPYSGAASAAYKPDFLFLKDGSVQDDHADLPPKITDRKSLLPRHPGQYRSPPKRGNEDLSSSRRSQLNTDGGVGPTDYHCTSWAYGDASLAYPSQMPQGIEGSRNAELLSEMGDTTDKAALLRSLAGRREASGKKPTMLENETNPNYLSRVEHPRCTITHRMEDEGHVKMTMYQSDYIDQGRMPELPGNHGQSDPRNTNQNYMATAGEMISGSLTKYTVAHGALRNSHGALLKNVSLTARSVVTPEVLERMRVLERGITIDKADPHRHKLR